MEVFFLIITVHIKLKFTGSRMSNRNIICEEHDIAGLVYCGWTIAISTTRSFRSWIGSHFDFNAILTIHESHRRGKHKTMSRNSCRESNQKYEDEYYWVKGDSTRFFGLRREIHIEKFFLKKV